MIMIKLVGWILIIFGGLIILFEILDGWKTYPAIWFIVTVLSLLIGTVLIVISTTNDTNEKSPKVSQL